MEFCNDLSLLFKEYNFSKDDEINFLKIIEPIFMHPEFQKRLNNSLYPHHGEISLGKHILHDAIVAYKIVQEKSKKKKTIDLKLAVEIAMFHDLYELPWQNSTIKPTKFINKHGFRHPIEAAINAINWFPEYFQKEDEAIILIDGILHHMYPFPVRAIDKDFLETEINNFDKLVDIPNNLIEIIISSSCRNNIFHVSFSKSKFIEGRILSKADKKVALIKEEPSFNSLKATVTGKNPDLY